MLLIRLLALILMVLVVIALTLARHRPALTPATRLLVLRRPRPGRRGLGRAVVVRVV